MKEQMWDNVELLRSKGPTVLIITNIVSMSIIADTLSALGASALISQASMNIDQMLDLSDSAVISLGTLTPAEVASAARTMRSSARGGRPSVLDAVGAGIRLYRNRVIDELLEASTPHYVFGNQTEILAVAGMGTDTDDPQAYESVNAVDNAVMFARNRNCVVAIEDEGYIVTDGVHTGRIKMGRVASELAGITRPAASAVIGAFAAVCRRDFMGAFTALSYMSVCSESASEALGKGGQPAAMLYDSLRSMTGDEFMRRLDISGV